MLAGTLCEISSVCVSLLDVDVQEAFYSYVTAVEAPNGAKGLQTKVIED